MGRAATAGDGSVALVPSSKCTTCSTGGGGGRSETCALDFRIAVGFDALACQTFMTSVESSGLGRSRTSLYVEIPFLVRFRRLGRVSLLASRFDMERNKEERISNYVNAMHSDNPFSGSGVNLESNTLITRRLIIVTEGGGSIHMGK